MNASDPRIRQLDRIKTIRRPRPGKTAPAAALLLAGLAAILVGLASFSVAAAEIVGGLLLVAAAVGYMRGSD